MLRSLLPLIGLSVLTACDSTPDPSFKQDAEERAAGQIDDPYAVLSAPPRPYAYSSAEPAQRASVASSFAVALASSIQAMLDKLSADKKLVKITPLEKQCRPAIQQALEFQASVEKADAALSRAIELYSALTKCRENAIRQAGTNARGADYANLLRRFASNGMALIGVSLVAKGDTENGLKLWREGDKLIDRDKPGFELGIKSFRGY